ncbi:hypothetical protein PGT21_006465 [Puccinia graminis f. sp. tritici]|uniref:C2H2-type domain-containing protein n=1 Tax=Puccinia graminis f. sp. tritici TaxID=56615 RepID=A0A5B0LYZ6_PUCGR|nr:hypothetical protein PGT21_006465 [Puccinia graminis f. sp. tritici]
MKLSMITNQTNSTADEESRKGEDDYRRYGGSYLDEVNYEDGMERDPSRLKRVRLNEEERKGDEEEGQDGQAGMDLRSQSWSKLQVLLLNQDKPIGRSTIINEMDEPELELEGESPSNSFHSSSSSTLTQSQHSSPLQPTTPDQSQPFLPSWATEPSGWSKQRVTDEMELLSVIEKQAETYSSGPESEALLTPGAQSQPTAWINHHHPPRQHHSLRVLQPPELIVPSFPSQPVANLPSPAIPAIPQEKPYKCSLCPKSFTRNYDLTRHKSSHIDQRQHRCSKCGRSFNRRDALIRHTLVKSCGNNP